MNGPQAIYASKVALASVLALAAAFLVDLQNTFWALLTIPLVARPDAGTMVWRSVARLAGTLIGALVALMLTGCFAQSADGIIASLALWIFATSALARLMSGVDGYAYAVAGLTAVVIVIDTGPDAPAAYGFALARATETAIAIVASFVVLLVVFPVSVEGQVTDRLASVRARILGLAGGNLSGDASVNVIERKSVFAELLLIHLALRAQAFERSRRHWRLPRLTRVAILMNQALVAADAASFALGRLSPDEREGRVAFARDRLCVLLRSYPSESARPTAIGGYAAELDRFIATLQPDTLASHPATAALSAGTLMRRVGALERLGRLAESLRDLLAAEVSLADPSASAEPARPISARYLDWTAALEAGLRPALTFLAVSSVWIFSGWSAGGTFTVLVGALVIMLPTILPRAILPRAGIMIGLGYAAGAAITLTLMATLPFVDDGFIAFACFIGATMFVIFYIGGRPQTLAVGIGATLMLAVGLQPANEPSYSPIALFNTVAILAFMPPVFVASMTILFPQDSRWLKRHLKRGLRSLLERATAARPVKEDAFIAQTLDIMGDYAGDLPADDPEVRRLVVLGRAVLVAGLEAYELRRLARSPRFPAALAALCPEVLASIRAASVGRSRKNGSDDVFAAVRGHVQTAVGAADGATPLAVLRFGAACELLEALIGSGDLGEPRSILPENGKAREAFA